MKKETLNETTYYVYSGDKMIAEYNSDGSWRNDFVYSGSRMIAKRNNMSGSDVEYFHTDYLGSVRAVTENQQGELIWTRDYYPFGELRNASGSNNKYQFCGKERDTETETDNSWHRQYAYKYGIFTQPDPAGQFASSYAYCGNNPIMYVDPDGLWFGWDDLIVSGVGFTVGYVSHGFSTGDWGKDAVVSGAITAASAWLALNTGGAAAGVLFNEGSAAFAITSSTVGGVVGSVSGNIGSQLYFTKEVDWNSVKNSAISGVAGGLAGGISGQYLTTDPVFTSMIGGGVGGGTNSMLNNRPLAEGITQGGQSGLVSGVLTTMAYEQYGKYLNNKNPELKGKFGTDVAKKGNSVYSQNDPEMYFCRDYYDDMRPYLNDNIKGVIWGDINNVNHIGFDIGGNLYGQRFILSKQGNALPIAVNTARSFTNGTWVGKGIWYKGHFFGPSESQYGKWRYIK